MKFSHLLLIAFLFLGRIFNAQDLSELDSIANHYIAVNNDTSITILEKELALATKSGNVMYIVKANRLLGYTNYFLAKYDKSLGYYLSALQLAEEKKLNNELLLIYNHLGTQYKKIKKPSEAKHWFTKGLNLARDLDTTIFVAGFYNDLGLVYEIENSPDSASVCFMKALDLYRSVGSEIGESYSLDYLSELESIRGNFSKGIEYIKQSLVLREKFGDKNAIAIGLNNLGEIYMAWKKNNEAISYFLKSLELSRQIKYHDLAQYTLRQLYQCYKATGDIDKALYYFEESSRLKDSIMNEKNLQNINELDAKYQSEKKQLLINNLNSENKLKAEKIKQQNYALVLFILFLLVLAVSILLIVKNSKKIKQAYKIINTQKEHVEAQKQQLEEKQKEILDSIHYASRIQNSLLTSEKFIDKALKKLRGK